MFRLPSALFDRQRELQTRWASLLKAGVRFTEMLPGPEGCWLQDADGHRYTSQLRVIAVDLTRWPTRSTLRQGWA